MTKLGCNLIHDLIVRDEITVVGFINPLLYLFNLPSLNF